MEFGNTEERLIECVVYTADTCVSGKLPSLQIRFSDTFNALRGHHIELTDATVTTVAEDRSRLQPTAAAIVSLSDIVFCHPAEDDKGAASANAAMAQERTKAFMVAHARGGITVMGMAHLPLGVALREYISRREAPFLPMTQCRVFQGEGNASLPFVLLNTDHVVTMYETKEVPMQKGRALPPLGIQGGNQGRPQAAPAAPMPSIQQRVAPPPPSRPSGTGGSGGILTRLVESRQGRFG